jgi:hypothetical protein
MGDNLAADLLAAYAVQLPLFAVCLVGLGVALARWRRHPRVSLAAAAGLLVLLAAAAAEPVVTLWLPRALIHQGRHIAEVGPVMQKAEAARYAVAAVGVVLLLMAVFAGRPRGGAGGAETDGAGRWSTG